MTTLRNKNIKKYSVKSGLSRKINKKLKKKNKNSYKLRKGSGNKRNRTINNNKKKSKRKTNYKKWKIIGGASFSQQEIITELQNIFYFPEEIDEVYNIFFTYQSQIGVKNPNNLYFKTNQELISTLQKYNIESDKEKQIILEKKTAENIITDIESFTINGLPKKRGIRYNDAELFPNYGPELTYYCLPYFYDSNKIPFYYMNVIRTKFCRYVTCAAPKIDKNYLNDITNTSLGNFFSMIILSNILKDEIPIIKIVNVCQNTEQKKCPDYCYHIRALKEKIRALEENNSIQIILRVNEIEYRIEIQDNQSSADSKIIKFEYTGEKNETKAIEIQYSKLGIWEDKKIISQDYLIKYSNEIIDNHTLIHCSAGVGRTGTLIIYHLINKYIGDKQPKKIGEDLFYNIIKMLRLERNCAYIPQTPKQIELLKNIFVLSEFEKPIPPENLGNKAITFFKETKNENGDYLIRDSSSSKGKVISFKKGSDIKHIGFTTKYIHKYIQADSIEELILRIGREGKGKTVTSGSEVVFSLNRDVTEAWQKWLK